MNPIQSALILARYKLITNSKSPQWTALYDFLAYLVKNEPNWVLRTVGNLGPIFNFCRSPETVKQLPPNSFDYLIDARCFEPLSVLWSLTKIEFDMDYFNLGITIFISCVLTVVKIHLIRLVVSWLEM